MKGVRRSVVCRFFCIVALSFATTIPAGAAQAAKSEPPEASKAASREPDSKPESKQEKQRREQISKNIQQILSDPLADRSFWGIQAVSLDTGRVLYEFNSGKLFTPASNTKLFTTAAALALIGPAYQFRTTVETTGALDRYGRVNGDIVLVGRGDPNLSGRVLPYHSAAGGPTSPLWVLEDLADQLVQKGVKFVDGSIIGDDSFFAFERYGEGWSQEDAVWEWGAPVSALTFNDNSVLVTLQPGDHPGDKAFASVTPFSELFQIDNRVVTTPAGAGPAKVALAREPGSNLLSISGSIPAGDSGLSYSLAINDPAEFAAQIFRAILVRKGIVVYGSSRARHAAPAGIPAPQAYQTPGGGDASAHAPLPFMVLATHESHPLAEDLTIINKESLNLHAEIMLRLLGHEKGSGGSIQSGSGVLKDFLTSAGIAPEEFVFLDGSGLSRQNLVTPAAVVKLLTYIDHQTWSETFRQTLPVAGVDGTLAVRFRGTPLEGRVFAKTGMLGHINALSGYATTLSGQRIAFSIMANNHNMGSHSAIQAVDRILSGIVDDRIPSGRRK